MNFLGHKKREEHATLFNSKKILLQGRLGCVYMQGCERLWISRLRPCMPNTGGLDAAQKEELKRGCRIG